jgi:hypothetical protein
MYGGAALSETANMLLVTTTQNGLTENGCCGVARVIRLSHCRPVC